MTAFEITLICLLSFLTVLVTCQVVAVTRAMILLGCLIRDLKNKLAEYNLTVRSMHRAARNLEQESDEFYSDHEGSINRLLDLAAHVSSLAMMGMGMWKQYRRRRK